MFDSYVVTLTNRALCGIGVPCEDNTRIIGKLATLPDSIESAENVVATFGIPIIHNSANYCDGFSAQIAVEPITGYDEAWIDIYPEA